MTKGVTESEGSDIWPAAAAKLCTDSAYGKAKGVAREGVERQREQAGMQDHPEQETQARWSSSIVSTPMYSTELEA